MHKVAGRWRIDILEVSLEYGAELDERVGCDLDTPSRCGWDGKYAVLQWLLV